MAEIHPTASVHPDAEIGDGVEIGAFCVVEQDVRIGAGTVLRPHAIIRRYTTLGEGNHVDSFCVLGGLPQDLKFDPNTPTYVRIGDRNRFREGVTINRATKLDAATTVGSDCYWMVNSHAGHDVTVGDRVILPNGCAIGGHATVERGAILSAHGAVHQFCWVGEGAMFQGGAMTGMHVPPFTMVAEVSTVVGLNTVGLRRNPEMSAEDRKQIKDAFAMLYRSGMTTRRALESMEQRTDWGPAATKFVDFVRRVVTAEKPFARGLCGLRKSSRSKRDSGE